MSVTMFGAAEGAGDSAAAAEDTPAGAAGRTAEEPDATGAEAAADDAAEGAEEGAAEGSDAGSDEPLVELFGPLLPAPSVHSRTTAGKTPRLSASLASSMAPSFSVIMLTDAFVLSA